MASEQRSESRSFRKKPVVIQAEQYIAESDYLPFCDEGHPVEYDEDAHKPYIQTLEGKLYVSDGDWIIRGVKGEFYACKPDIFAMTYEPADAQSSEIREPELTEARLNSGAEAIMDLYRGDGGWCGADAAKEHVRRMWYAIFPRSK